MDPVVYMIVYLALIIPMAFLFGCIAENDDKYDALHSLIWPYGLILLLIDLFNFINSYLTKNNLKQMNFKILGKAMGFMFLPTLGVLLMLLIGFFDPIMLWTWIKSDSGWAIFTRIFIFLLETGLVTVLYFNYLKEETVEKIKNSAEAIGQEEDIYSATDVYRLFTANNSCNKFTLQRTEDPNIVIIKQIKK